ncbi:MAG: tetratricopeptide repeat protein [Candidatus Hodarchaeales archaeon]|jgi:tetratricopeptide (TPR) repeat protein/DNA-binding MarR family transcriptional regulator
MTITTKNKDNSVIQLEEWHKSGLYQKVIDNVEIVDPNNIWIVIEAHFQLSNYIQIDELLQKWKDTAETNVEHSLWLYYSGLLALNQDKRSKARNLLEEAKGLLNKSSLKENEIKAKVFRVLGFCDLKDGQIEEAFEVFNKAEKLAEKTKKRNLIASIAHGIGYVYEIQEQYERAQCCYEKALQIRKELDNPLEIAKNLLSLGRFHQLRGNLKEAKEYLKEALEISDKFTNPSLIGKIYAFLGGVYQAQGLLEKARDCHSQARNWFEEKNDPLDIAWSLSNLGSVYHELGDLDTAYQFCELSLKTFEEHERQQYHIAEALLDLIKIEFDLGLLCESSPSLTRFPENHKGSVYIEGFKLMIQALVAQSEQNYGLAEKYWSEASNLSNIKLGFSNQIYCQEKLMEISFHQLINQPNNTENRQKFEQRLQEFEELCKYPLYSGIAKSLLLRAKLSKLDLNFENTKQYLEMCLSICEKYDLKGRILTEADLELKTLKEQEKELTNLLGVMKTDYIKSQLLEISNYLKKSTQLTQSLMGETSDQNLALIEPSSPPAINNLLKNSQHQKILHLLRKYPEGILQKDLPNLIKFSKATVSRRVNELVDLGVVQRLPHAKTMKLRLAEYYS